MPLSSVSAFPSTDGPVDRQSRQEHPDVPTSTSERSYVHYLLGGDRGEVILKERVWVCTFVCVCVCVCSLASVKRTKLIDDKVFKIKGHDGH